MSINISFQNEKVLAWISVDYLDSCDFSMGYTNGQFQKLFTCVAYSPSKISCTAHCMHAPMQCVQNAQAYFGAVIGYRCKIFMNLTPGANVVKLFSFIADDKAI